MNKIATMLLRFLILPLLLVAIPASESIDHHFPPAIVRVDAILNTLKYLWEQTANVMNKLIHFKEYVFRAGRGKEFGDVDMCTRNLVDLTLGLIERQMWAIQMVDACSKLPSGIMVGNVIDLGSFEECMNLKTDQGFSGQYCLAKILLYYKNESSNPFHRVLLGGDTSIKLALCVPSSCSPSLLHYLINDTVSDLTENRKVKVNVEIKPENCYSRERPTEPLGLVHWTAIFIGLLVLSVIVLATCLDIYTEDFMSPYLAAFSFRRNFRKLFESCGEPDCFRILYGLRFFNVIWILLANRYHFFSEQPVLNAFQTLDLFKQWSTMIIFAAPLASDTFLLISGFLNAYFSLKTLKRGKFPFGGSFIFRYLRLTSSVLVMQAVTALLLPRLGEGPLWNQVVGPEIDNCKNYWYSGLLYIGNYFNPNSQCLRHSWYLDINMQLTLLSPLLLYPLSKSPLVGKMLLAASLVISVLVPTYVSYIDQIPHPITISRNQTVVDYENRVSFVPTHMRLSSYLVGIACGYFIYQMKQNDRPIKLHGLYRLLLWTLSLASLIVAMFGGYWLYQLDYQYNRIYSSLYIGFHRILWSIGMAWIIIGSISSAKPGLIIRALSSSFFVPLGKLTYSLYLVYLTVLLYQFGTTKSPFYYSFIGTIYHFSGDLVIDLTFAFFLCMLIEMPVTNLLREIRFRISGEL